MANAIEKLKERFRLLLNPWVVFASIGAGVVNGLFFKSFAVSFAPVGDMFLGAMQMCVIPILIFAVTGNTAKILSHHGITQYLKRFLILIVVGLLVSSFIGLGVAVITNAGNRMSPAAQAAFGHMMAAAEGAGKSTLPSVGLIDFLKQMVPPNIFTAIAEGRNLSILVFSLIFGVSLGVSANQDGAITLQMIDVLLGAFLRIMNAIMYLLPFGMFCLLSSHLATIGPDIIPSLAFYMVIVSVGMFGIVIFSALMIWRMTGVGPLRALMALRKAFLVAIGTSSSFATMPTAMQCLEDELGLNSESTRLVFPLAVCLNPWGNAFYFTFTTVFIAQVYHIHLTFESVAISILGSTLVSIASAGIPAVSSLSLMSIALTPLGLPVETAVIIVLATTPILDPLITLANIAGVCATTASIAANVTAVDEVTPVQRKALDEGRSKASVDQQMLA